MIPKIIHYIWLGKAPKSNLIKICINSWYEKMADYEIIEWNESNLDLDSISKKNHFFNECRKRKLWAYMADYLRLLILYENGGIYFDTDIQVIKSLTPLLSDNAFLGMEVGDHYGTGVIAAEKGNIAIKKILDFYENDIWETDIYTIPWIFNRIINYNKELFENVKIYPREWFSPYDYEAGPFTNIAGPNTYTIHWFDGSWKDNVQISLFLQTKHIKNRWIRKFVQFRKLIGIFYRKFKIPREE